MFLSAATLRTTAEARTSTTAGPGPSTSRTAPSTSTTTPGKRLFSYVLTSLFEVLLLDVCVGIVQ